MQLNYFKSIFDIDYSLYPNLKVIIFDIDNTLASPYIRHPDKDVKEYIKQSEPGKRDKGYAWHTAIGLQAVDGLKPSKYLIDTAIQNIEGKITMKEAQSLIDSYYERLKHGMLSKARLRHWTKRR